MGEIIIDALGWLAGIVAAGLYGYWFGARVRSQETAYWKRLATSLERRAKGLDP
jgi:hypothetical protein